MFEIVPRAVPAEGGAGSIAYRNRRDEAITTRRHGLDHSVAIAPSVQSLAQGGDVDGEVHFLDERVRPHFAQQIIFRDQMPGAANQHNEEIEGLGGGETGSPLHSNRRSVSARVKSPKSKIWSSEARIARA